MNEDPYARFGFTKDALIEAIRLGEGRFTKRELAKSLGLKGDQRSGLKLALRELEDGGEIRKNEQKAYEMADQLPAVTVLEVIDRDVDGEFICQPVKPELQGPKIILKPGERTRGPAAGIGDRILARLAPMQGEDGYEASVIKKLGQSAHRILCVLRDNTRGPARLVPVDRRVRHELVPARGETSKAEDGDLVIVRIASERRHGLKTALIDEVVGRADSARAGSIIAMAEHGVSDGFLDAELKQVDAIEPVTMGNREDLRDIPLVTIDPVDARDHDDAVWAAPDDDPKNPDGWIVIVAIADVAAYVTPASPLDKGARNRGVSVYLPDRVVPMLPERLSNDLCSLREGEERPCLAVRMVFDRNGNQIAHRFIRGWMRSAAKLAYEDAQSAIDGKGSGKAETLLEDVLKPLWGAYDALRQARKRREPLEIDAPERKVVVDEHGRVQGVRLRERFDAHKLIEEMMIQANVAAATALEARNSPLIYRIHDEPGSEKLDNLADFLPHVGLKWTRGERPTPSRFNTLLQASQSTDHYETVNEVVLRSQSQAVYDTDNIGHFGLNLAKYAHFTSPIRRYADLTVHRALIRAYNLGSDGQTDEERSQLQRIAEDTTSNERRAMAAERDAVDRFIAAWLADRVGTEFEGRITGVTRFGLFVRLHETGADGLCPVSRLGQEYYMHDEAAHALVGQSSGGRYRLGMAVTVRLDEATPVTGGLLFDILTPPESGKPPKGRGRPRDKYERRGPPRAKKHNARRKIR
ncbi:ribonuclease R [Oceanicaulis sp. LC35]|uniref:ribonuclease R n=1 Tax=Oceanicaulis sp. LC35 TaxID=3349635 RepID=UPI003F838E31